MRDYAKLSKALRMCKMSIPCTECPFYSNGDSPSKECGTMNDAAADAIEELLAKMPTWISVEERLPEINDDVLVCNMDYGKTELGFATDAVWDGDNFLSAWNRASAIHCVTHWMPLPAPLKGVE